MYRWSACPGSVRMSEGIAQKSSAYAEEGTLGHEVAAHYLEKLSWPSDAAPEMIGHLQVYVDAVLSSRPKGAKILIEHGFDLGKIHPGMFGTADAVIYDAEKKLLQVFDLKYGAGIPVEVKDNPQLIYYALGALLSLNVPCDEVESVIVQPRCDHADGPVRRHRYEALDLLDFAADLVRYAKKTEDPNAPLIPGDHCRFCPAAGICPQLHSDAQAVAKNEFRSDLSYDPKKLSETLEKLPILEAFVKAVREFAYGEAEHGRCPPRWKLVQKRATRRWKNEEDAVILLQKNFGLKPDQILDPPAIKSPPQVEKLFSASKKTELNELIVAESSGLTLVPETDKRESAKRDAKTEFAQIPESIFE